MKMIECDVKSRIGLFMASSCCMYFVHAIWEPGRAGKAILRNLWMTHGFVERLRKEFGLESSGTLIPRKHPLPLWEPKESVRTSHYYFCNYSKYYSNEPVVLYKLTTSVW